MSGHDHSHGHSHGLKREGNRAALAGAFGITAFIMVAEVVGGWLTNSLALLSDAGHMLSDTASLGLSLAAIGLLANLVSAWVLLRQGDVKDNLNLRSAYLHVLGDALGSVGAIVAGILMYLFGWYIADPIVSVLVALLILRGAWGVVSQSVHILMEGAPSGADVAAIVASLEGIEGVCNVHDVHVWTVTSGYDVFSGHIVVCKGTNISRVVEQGATLLEKNFGIRHSTIQVLGEEADCRKLGCGGSECPFEVAAPAGS